MKVITRLRCSHICTGLHFQKIRWNLLVDYEWGAEFRDLEHLIHECPVLLEGRSSFWALSREDLRASPLNK